MAQVSRQPVDTRSHFSCITASMAFVPPLVIAGVAAMKIMRNLSCDDSDTKHPEPGRIRKNSVVERLKAGSTPPVAHFCEQHLERMIKTNSACRDAADELRAARRAGIGGGSA